MTSLVFFQLFAQGEGGELNDNVWIIGGGGKYVKLGGSRDMLPWEIFILDLLLDTIWWNLGLFSHKHKLPFIVSLKLL